MTKVAIATLGVAETSMLIYRLELVIENVVSQTLLCCPETMNQGVGML